MCHRKTLSPAAAPPRRGERRRNCVGDELRRLSTLGSVDELLDKVDVDTEVLREILLYLSLRLDGRREHDDFWLDGGSSDEVDIDGGEVGLDVHLVRGDELCLDVGVAYVGPSLNVSDDRFTGGRALFPALLLFNGARVSFV
jgi:hypothetical protein